jgi:hypothetical protein
MLKKFIAKDKEGRWFMKIKDKIETKEILKDNKERCCPPHKIPHTLFDKKVTNEPCHVHKAFLRNLHHKSFCKLLKCPPYKDMMKTNDIL